MPGQFFFQQNGQVIGPFSPDEVKRQIRSGKIRLDDEVGSASAGPWRKIGDVRPLAKLFQPESVADLIDDVPDDASQLPPQRQKKKTTPEVTKQPTEKGADKQGLSGGVIVSLCVGAVLVFLVFVLGAGAGLVVYVRSNHTEANEQLQGGLERVNPLAKSQELEKSNAVAEAENARLTADAERSRWEQRRSRLTKLDNDEAWEMLTKAGEMDDFLKANLNNREAVRVYFNARLPVARWYCWIMPYDTGMEHIKMFRRVGVRL